VKVLLPAASSTFVTEVRPGANARPSLLPRTEVRLLTFEVKSAAPRLDSITRRYSSPPRRFLALAGTTNGSPAVPRTASKGSLSPVVRLGVGATVIWKPAGVTSFCSFSSQAPQERNAARPRHHSVCDWMWSIPAEPASMKPSTASWL
jgi:hypothetical protein